MMYAYDAVDQVTSDNGAAVAYDAVKAAIAQIK